MLTKSAKYKRIGTKLINTLPEFDDLKGSGVRIAYLVSDEFKVKNRKTIFADCNKVNSRYEWCCDYDFFIVFYELNYPYFNQEQIETLVRHELKHVGIDYTGKEPAYYVVPHDIEEFWTIIEDCGIHWSEDNAQRR